MTIAEVARDLLGLDPDVLARMDWREGDPNRGFNILIRRAMAYALALRDEAVAAVRLMSEEAARADRWPDARTANVAMVIAWALLGEVRESFWLPAVPLVSADRPKKGARRSSSRTDEAEPATAFDLCQAFNPRVVKWTEQASARRNAQLSTPSARTEGMPIASTNAAIRDTLGLEPREMADMLDRRGARRLGATFEADPEAAGRAGLLGLLRDALVQFGVMRAREVDRIRLMSDVEATEQGWVDARAVRFATLVAAALLHGDPSDVVLLPPRDPRPEREDLLVALARDVYFHGSETAFQGLELLCDDDVHFGVDRGRDKARRLLWSVSKAHDPQGLRLREMPTTIAESMTLVESDEMAMARRS